MADHDIYNSDNFNHCHECPFTFWIVVTVFGSDWLSFMYNFPTN